MAPSSGERALGARTRLLLPEFAAGGNRQSSSSERPHAGQQGVTLRELTAQCGDLRAEAGRQGGREGGLRSHC